MNSKELFGILIFFIFFCGIWSAEFWKGKLLNNSFNKGSSMENFLTQTGNEETCFHNSGYFPSPKCRIHCLKEKHFSAACDNLGRCFCLRKKPSLNNNNNHRNNQQQESTNNSFLKKVQATNVELLEESRDLES